jgi:uncharacterized membrane protein YgdD (TMEM256/DUF423 family)
MNNHITKLIAALGALGIIIGAFGAHAIKLKINESQYAAYQTGVWYHFIHTIAILALYIWHLIRPSKVLIRSIFLMTVGILFFSGSLYLLSIRDLLGLQLTFLGPVTPIGGMLLLFGWLNLALINREHN